MSEATSILFLGDVVPYKQFKFRNDIKTVINLECPIIKSGKPVSGKVNLRVPENLLDTIFEDKLLAVSLSNNHIMDYGVEGLNSTLFELKKKGIQFFGVNLPDDDTHNPVLIDHNGVSIALQSIVSESTSPLVEFDDFNYLTTLGSTDLQRIGEIRKEVQKLVIYIHWGNRDSSYPSDTQVNGARKLIDAGADIVIGSHSHAPQSVEKYKHGIIAYNLGNFIMPEFRNTPSFFDEDGNSLSVFTRKLMIWNRFSWGIEIDMATMDFRVRKFFFIADRIIELKSTPLDRYIMLPDNFNEERYNSIMSRHLKKKKAKKENK